MEAIQIYDTGNASGNAVAQVVIPSKTRIRQVTWAVWVQSITASGELVLQLSRASASEITVNGAQQVISQVAWAGNFVTSGMAQGGINQFFPVDVPVSQGQILYLHALMSGTVLWDASVLLWY